MEAFSEKVHTVLIFLETQNSITPEVPATFPQLRPQSTFY